MRRMFTEDVIRESGTPRFRKGEIREYPKGTWTNIANSLKRDLDDFTMEPTEAAQLAVNARESSRNMLERAVPKKAAPETVVKEEKVLRKKPVRRQLSTQTEE